MYRETPAIDQYNLPATHHLSLQGDGPVNTIGAFFPGELALLKFNLTQWQILKGDGRDKYIVNWNGERSPVVHQYDRFQESDIKPHARYHFAAMQGLKW